MNEIEKSSSEHSILDLLALLKKWRKIILLVVGIALIIGIASAFIVSRKYKSVARVLPPKQTNVLSNLTGLSSLVRNLPGGLGRLGKTDDNYDYIAILRSRTSMESLIKKFNLVQVYDIPGQSMEKCLEKFNENFEIDWTEENILEIRVWDTDAQRAADIANYCVELLNTRNYELQTKEARNSRIFIEQRLVQNKADLTVAEDKLKAYQEKEKMMIPSDAASGSISAIGEIYSEKVKKEIALGILRRTVGENNATYEQARLELNVLESEIAKLPELGMSSLRLYRDVVIQQKIMELILPLYEQAKVDEHKDVPVAYVLDMAVPGEKPDSPKRIFIVGIALFLGFIGAFVYIGFKEYLLVVQENSPEKLAQFKLLKKFAKIGK